MKLTYGMPLSRRDLERAAPLLDCVGRQGTAEDGRVVGQDDALGIGDDADTDEHPATNRVVRLVSGERTDLEEGRVRVEHLGDALTHGHLAQLSQTIDAIGTAARLDLLE